MIHGRPDVTWSQCNLLSWSRIASDYDKCYCGVPIFRRLRPMSLSMKLFDFFGFLLISLLCIFFRRLTVLVTQTAVWVLHEWARSRPMTHLAIFFLFFLCFEWKKGICDADPRLWSCSTNGCFLLALDPQRLEKCHCRLSFFLDCLLWLCGATVLHFWFTCFLLKPLPVLHCCSSGKWQMSRMNARWTIIEWKHRAAALQSTLECRTFFHPFLGATNILSDGWLPWYGLLRKLGRFGGSCWLMRKSWRRTCSDLVVLFHFDLVTTSSSEGHTEMTDMTW